MNKRLENKLTTYEGISSLFDEHDAVVQSINNFGSAVAAYNSALAGIRSKAIEVRQASAGKTTDKHKAEEELDKCLMPVCSALYILAEDTGNNSLAELTDIGESRLDRMRDTEKATFGDEIATLAAANAAGIAEYGITADMAADARTKADAYLASIGSKESGIADRKGLRKSLEDMFPALDRLLDRKIDKFMNIAKLQDEEFFDKYEAAKIIRDAGVRHRKAVEEEAVGAAGGA